MRKTSSQWKVAVAVVCMAAISAAGCKSGGWNMPGTSWLTSWSKPSNSSIASSRASTLPSPPSQNTSPTTGLASSNTNPYAQGQASAAGYPVGQTPYGQASYGAGGAGAGAAGTNPYTTAQNTTAQNTAAQPTGQTYTGPLAGAMQQGYDTYNQTVQGAQGAAQAAYGTATTAYQGATDTYQQAASAMGGYPAHTADTRSTAPGYGAATGGASDYSQASATDYGTAQPQYGQAPATAQPQYGQAPATAQPQYGQAPATAPATQQQYQNPAPAPYTGTTNGYQTQPTTGATVPQYAPGTTGRQTTYGGTYGQ